MNALLFAVILSSVADAGPVKLDAMAPCSPQDEFLRANAAYEAGKVADALTAWEGLYARGLSGASLCYNIGCAHFRLGRRGHAILWFERARRLAPRDEDIRFNLSLARSHLPDETVPPWETFDRLLAPGELAVVVAILLAFLLAAIGFGALTGRDLGKLKPWFAGTTVILVVLGVWLALRARDLAAPQGFVVAAAAEVRSGPGEEYTAGFTVPEGRRALLLSVRNGWVEIGVPGQGLKGWVREEAVRKL